MLVRLLYASRPAEQSANSFVDDILKSCRENNPQHGITGVLCFSEQAFLQLIEGDRVAINRVYGQIVQDQRHTDVSLLHYEEINERIFGSWTMGQVNLERINPSVILKYCPL
ncbi:MAG: BLUF domain-containing protein, partial [Betaproteobacteria bacterium]|nr:BLUF domain-containing protein [Betaproteobacteria bacterium]